MQSEGKQFKCQKWKFNGEKMEKIIELLKYVSLLDCYIETYPKNYITDWFQKIFEKWIMNCFV